MRKYLLQAFFALCVLVIPALAAAAPEPTPADKASVATILAQYPNGGQGLTNAIAQAVETDPSLSDAIVAAAVNASPAVQQAIGAGLAQAAIYFANTCTGTGQGRSDHHASLCATAQQQIQAAMAVAPVGLLTAFDLAGGLNALVAVVTNVVQTLITQHCVSPSRPGLGC